MKSVLSKSTVIASLLFLLVFCFSFSSCKKSDPTCTAIITILDSSGAVVPGAVVMLDAKNATPPGDLTASVTSDAEGKATFVLKLPCVLDVTATEGGRAGAGVVYFDSDKVAILNVTIK